MERQVQLDQVIAFLNTPSEVKMNIEGIEAIRQQAENIVDEKKKEIGEIQEKIINDYDLFIDSLQTTLVSDNTDNKTLSSAFFNANHQLIDTVKTEPHPTTSYLKLNKKVMEGFSHALATRSPEELNMSLLTYNETKQYVSRTLGAVNAGLEVIDDKKEPILLAANSSGNPS